MDEFLRNVTTGYWWISVVVVGVLINILSTVLVKRFEVFGSTVSSWLRGRSEERRKAFQAEVDRLVRGVTSVDAIYQEETRWRFRAATVLLLGVFFGVMLSSAHTAVGPSKFMWPFAAVASGVLVLGAFKLDAHADHLQRVVREARKVLRCQAKNTLGLR